MHLEIVVGKLSLSTNETKEKKKLAKSLILYMLFWPDYQYSLVSSTISVSAYLYACDDQVSHTT